MEKYQGRPFVLLGINSDRKSERVRKLMENGTVTWNSWMDGSSKGPISSRWDIQGWPSIYVLDHRGVIRHRGREVDELIEELVEEAEENR